MRAKFVQYIKDLIEFAHHVTSLHPFIFIAAPNISLYFRRESPYTLVPFSFPFKKKCLHRTRVYIEPMSTLHQCLHRTRTYISQIDIYFFCAIKNGEC